MAAQPFNEHIEIRYIGPRNFMEYRVQEVDFYWPARGAYIPVKPVFVPALLKHPTVFVVADSENDPMNGVPADGLVAEGENDVPVTTTEKVLDLAKQIARLDGVDLAMSYWNGDLYKDASAQATKPAQPVTGVILGASKEDVLFAAFNVFVGNNPDMDDPELFGQDKRPRIDPVREATNGMELSKAELNDYWDKYLAETQA